MRYLSKCDDWRGIALLDVVGKVVARIIQERRHTHQLEPNALIESSNSCNDSLKNNMQYVVLMS